MKIFKSKEGVGYRISNTQIYLLVGSAVLFDVVSLVPGLNIITMTGAGVVYFIWFLILGLGFLNFKKIVTWSVSGIAEYIPAVSFLPGITFAVAVMIAISRVEDETGISIPKPGGKKSKKRSRGPKRSGGYLKNKPQVDGITNPATNPA